MALLGNAGPRGTVCAGALQVKGPADRVLIYLTLYITQVERRALYDRAAVQRCTALYDGAVEGERRLVRSPSQPAFSLEAHATSAPA